MDQFQRGIKMAEIFDHNSIVKRINNDLTSSKTRDRGITGLQAYLYQCPDEAFSNNCVNWMTHCCKNDDGNPKSVITACQTLRELLLTSTKFPELKKSVSNFIGTRFFEYFLKYLSDSEDGWLCAEACFNSYKGACGPYEGKIKQILQEILNKNVKISKTVADCYALLPALGGGGHGSVNYRTNWKNQFVKVINLTHAILNQLFSNVMEIQSYETTVDDDEFENLSNEHLMIILNNYCLILGAMLKNKYPVSKPIPVDSIINLICRGLAVTPKTLGNQLTSSIINLKNLIPQIHIILYSVLSALIVTCKTALYPYAHLFCKLFKQSLEWTESDYKYGCEKPFSSLRVAIYSALSNWIVAGKSGCCAEMISSGVIFAFKKDFIPQKPTLLLQGTEKAKEAKQNEKSQVNRVNENANAKLCFSALKTMQLYVKYLGGLLKKEEHSELQNAVVRELMEIQCAPSLSDISIPYSVPSCRLELYTVLLAITVTPHAHYPPPTQFALRIFSQGLNDKNPQISKFCASALNDLTNIIHPSFKVATFPLEFANMKVTTTVEFRKETEKSVDLVWRERNSQEDNMDAEEPMEVDETILEPEGNQEKDLIEFSMVEINDLKDCLKSPKKGSPQKVESPKKAEKESPKRLSSVQEVVELEKSPVKESPEKESKEKVASPKKSTPAKQQDIETLNISDDEVEEITEISESPAEVEKATPGSPKKTSPAKQDKSETSESARKMSPVKQDESETAKSPKKTSPAKQVGKEIVESLKSPNKASPVKQDKNETSESPKKTSPAKHVEQATVDSSKEASPVKQNESETSESTKITSPAKQIETATSETPGSPKKTSPAKQPIEIATSESPKKPSPAKPQISEDSVDAVPVTDDSEKRQTPTSEISDTSESPVRRSSRLLQNTGEKSKSDAESPKASPSPKRKKTETPNVGEEASSQESEEPPQEENESEKESESKLESLKEPVLKIRKLSESVVGEADKSISEEKRYNLRRSKAAAKSQEEGEVSTPKRGRPSIKSGNRSERSSSSESATGRTSKRNKVEKPKEEDIMELFDESLKD